jgi:hypothetical protein
LIRYQIAPSPFRDGIVLLSNSVLDYVTERSIQGYRHMGARRIRREQRRVDMALSRHDNGILKTKERARRKLRMIEIIKKGSLPYAPPVMSWLSGELDKPSRLITPEDVKKAVS